VMSRVEIAIKYCGCVAEAVVGLAHVGVEVVSVERTWEHIVVVGANVAEVIEVIAKGLCAAAVAVLKICHLREGDVHAVVLWSVAEGSGGFVLGEGSTDGVDVVPVGALVGMESGVGVGDAVDIIEVEVTMAEWTMRSGGMLVWSGGVVGAVASHGLCVSMMFDNIFFRITEIAAGAPWLGSSCCGRRGWWRWLGVLCFRVRVVVGEEWWWYVVVIIGLFLGVW
jgi:hypothetical protein